MKITVGNLWKSYGGKPVFENFSTEFASGEVAVLMGRSGCGKTTFMRILLGLEKPDQGSILGVPEKKSAVFQEDRLFEAFCAVANVRAAIGKGGFKKRIREEEIRENLEAVGLFGEELKKPVSALSGGMRRRTAIVRAMMADSELVILDEPFEGLDEETKKKTIDYVKKHRNGRTLLLVTHNREEGEAMGGRFIILEKEGDRNGRED